MLLVLHRFHLLSFSVYRNLVLELAQISLLFYFQDLQFLPRGKTYAVLAFHLFVYVELLRLQDHWNQQFLWKSLISFLLIFHHRLLLLVFYLLTRALDLRIMVIDLVQGL